jgi:hypothetical protein
MSLSVQMNFQMQIVPRCKAVKRRRGQAVVGRPCHIQVYVAKPGLIVLEQGLVKEADNSPLVFVGMCE